MRVKARAAMNGSTIRTRNLVYARKTRTDGTLLLFILPFILLILLFNYVPIAGWLLSFYNYKPGIPLSKTPFVGLFNFKLMIDNRNEILRIIRNTIVLGMLAIACTPLPVVIALLMNEVKSSLYRKFAQTIITIPHFVSWIIVYSLSFALFGSDGLMNRILGNLGLLREPYNILGDLKAAWFFQTALTVWKTLGWNTIIYMAAIASIDQELYSAAKIDGANRLQCTIHITLPGILSAFIVILLITVSSILNMGFDQYFVFNNPLVSDYIEVLDLYLYRIGITTFDYSYAMALGMLKSLLSIALLFMANRLAKLIRGQSII